MKILDRYIARQLLGVTALGVMSLSALLLLGNLFKETDATDSLSDTA